MPLYVLLAVGLSLINDTTEREENFKQYFDDFGVEGSFILLDESEQQYTYYNKERCHTAYSPASTFKIPNTLIALEENIVEDENTIIYWGGKEWSISAWNQDLPLKNAFRFSCVPCYIQMAEQISEDQYRKHLQTLGYGNQDPGGSERNAFWLDGNLRISAKEQIDFLQKLYHEELPYSQAHLQIVKNILLEETTEDHRLSAKSGWNDQLHNTNLGWYVGYLVKNEKVYYFATNIESRTPDDNFIRARKEITMNILKALKII